MNTVLFIVLIMMIIIFINELKNISLSFFKINYIKDVSDINIKKYCNDIYCEAETSRFKIADNSYNLLSSNDIFNTKTYYVMILIIILAIYAHIFYNLIEYNNVYCLAIDNIDGNIIRNIIKSLPIILGIAVFTFALIIIIARYIPSDRVGYKNYFNYNNPLLSGINTYNIENISYYILSTIVVIGVLYILIALSANILEYPDEQRIKGSKYKFLSIGYFIIIVMFSYLILNFMNILLTFSNNKYPKLDGDILNAIVNKLENKIAKLSDIYIVKNIVKDCYKIAPSPQSLTRDKLVLFKYIYAYITNITYRDDLGYRVEANFKLNIDDTITYKFKGTSITDKSTDGGTIFIPLTSADIPVIKINNLFPTNGKTTYNNYYNALDSKKKPAIGNTYNPEDILNNFSLRDYKGIKDELTNIKKSIDETSKSTDPLVKENWKILLKILICFSINEMKNFNEDISKYIKDNLKDNVIKNNIYKKHQLLVELTDYILKCIYNSKEIESNDGSTKIKRIIVEYIDFKTEEGSVMSKSNFFGINYEPFSSPLESQENYSVDFSYNSENTFYEKYFGFLENLNNPSYYDLEYDVGSYYIKNIKTLAYFILIIFAVSIIYLIIFYIQYTDILYKYFDEIILPVIILLIFILYIIVFINYNTNYNLNFIYGALNSSYKRDLNDLNNMIIPFISYSYKRDNYIKGPYYELYLITNVLMSFIYYNNLSLADSEDAALGKFDIVIDSTGNAIESFEDIDYDYSNFKDYHNKFGNLIYKKLYRKNDMLKDDVIIVNSDKNLFDYINEKVTYKDIIDITSNIGQFNAYIGKFAGIKTDLINIINNLISSFKNYDKTDKDTKLYEFFKEYVMFYTNNDNKKIWNKFLLKKEFFDDYKKYNDKSLLPEDKKQIFSKLFSNTYDKSYIDEHVNEYTKILSHYHFNKLISAYPPSGQPDGRPSANDILVIIRKNTDSSQSSLMLFIDNYRNMKLFRLLLLQKQKYENKNLNINDTFLITDAVSKNTELTSKDEFIKATDLQSIYYKLISSGLINLDKSNNYLMNIIKSVYYQINNKRIEYNIPVDDNNIGSDCSIYKIISKNPFVHENIINDNANNTIGYELFATYFINMVMIGIIYNLALVKNNNINKLF